MPDYKVQFEVVEGPLDLLLYLIKKEEVDIYEVNLTKIATEFIRYIEMMRELDLEVAGEFLVMASTLMYIKSRELLPVDQQVEAPEEEEDAEDPRWELIRRLVEYKKFKDVASRLQEREVQQENIFPRQPGKPQIAEPDAPPPRLPASPTTWCATRRPRPLPATSWRNRAVSLCSSISGLPGAGPAGPCRPSSRRRSGPPRGRSSWSR